MDLLRALYYKDDFSILLWDENTVILYYALVFVALAVGVYLNKQKQAYVIKTNYKPPFVWYALFFVIFFLSAFRDVGADIENYRTSFHAYATGKYIDTTLEEGYKILCRIIGIISSNEHFGIAAFSFLSVAFVHYSIKRYANQLHLALALMSFVGIFYFQSFNLVRIYLTAYFLTMTFHYYLEGRLVLYSLLILLAAQVHTSAILMMIPVLGMWLYRRSAVTFWLGLLFVLLAMEATVHFFIRYINVVRYAGYIKEFHSSGQLPVLQIGFHLPLFLLSYYFMRINGKSTELASLIVLIASSFLVGYMGYYLPLIGRAFVFFMPAYILLIPIEIQKLRLRNRNYFILLSIFYGIYILLRCHIYFWEYLYLDQIIPYKTIF